MTQTFSYRPVKNINIVENDADVFLQASKEICPEISRQIGAKMT
jgi:hypothetical protein